MKQFCNAYINTNAEVLLSQNNPNPFTGTTSIQYTLPPTYKTATIVFSEASGRTVKAIDLSHQNVNNRMISINAEIFLRAYIFIASLWMAK
jgi:hypothetical protein